MLIACILLATQVRGEDASAGREKEGDEGLLSRSISLPDLNVSIDPIGALAVFAIRQELQPYTAAADAFKITRPRKDPKEEEKNEQQGGKTDTETQPPEQTTQPVSDDAAEGNESENQDNWGEGALPISDTQILPVSASGYVSDGQVYIKNSTDFNIDLKKLLKEKINIKMKPSSKILIVHTHTTESYSESGQSHYYPGSSDRSDDPSKNVVAVGDRLGKKLKEKGFKVIHDTVINDKPNFNSSYNNMRQRLSQHLKSDPEINVILDIHRDSIVKSDGTKYRPVVEIKGKRAAQMMLVVGTSQGGLEHPNWQENLKFAVHIQKNIEKLYPGLMRPIDLRIERFNQHATNGSLIIEVGSSGNSLEEAIYATDLLAEGIAKTLAG